MTDTCTNIVRQCTLYRYDRYMYKYSKTVYILSDRYMYKYSKTVYILSDRYMYKYSKTVYILSL